MSISDLEQRLRAERAAEQREEGIMRRNAELIGMTPDDMVESGRRMAEQFSRSATVQAARKLQAAADKASNSMRNATPGDKFDIDQTRTPEYRSAWLSRMRGTATQRQRDILMVGEHRDLSLGTNAAGGYTVPHDFLNRVQMSQAWAGAIRSVATVLNTPDGRPLDMPITDATSGGASILAENVAGPAQVDPVFSTVSLKGEFFVCPPILVPWDMIRDRSFLPDGVQPMNDSEFDFASSSPGHIGRHSSPQPVDIMQFAADIGGFRLSLGEEPFFATGNGSGQPLGVLPGLSTAITTASPTAILWTELVALWASVNAVYRTNAVWMMSTATAVKLQDLEDSAGQPLFNPAWGPLKILGSDVIINDQFPGVASATSPIVYGNFARGYYVRSSGVLSIPLVERYAASLQSALIIAERVDGSVTDTKALAKLTMHV